MDSCIFCKLVRGEIPSYKVWEDQDYLAFLDINPIKLGHSMVIPKKHAEYLFDLEDEDLNKIMLASKKVASLLKKAFNPKSGKIGVIVYGLDVPHAHVHLVPIDRPGDLSFSKAQSASQEQLSSTLSRIKSSQ